MLTSSFLLCNVDRMLQYVTCGNVVGRAASTLHLVHTPNCAQLCPGVSCKGAVFLTKWSLTAQTWRLARQHQEGSTGGRGGSPLVRLCGSASRTALALALMIDSQSPTTADCGPTSHIQRFALAPAVFVGLFPPCVSCLCECVSASGACGIKRVPLTPQYIHHVPSVSARSYHRSGSSQVKRKIFLLKHIIHLNQCCF